MNEGTFVVTNKAYIPNDELIFGSRFVDDIKRAGKLLRNNSRLVVQNYSYIVVERIATKAPTVHRASQRWFLTLAASHPHMTVYIRDVTQAYVQS